MLEGPLLIANRGEIALRIAATARRLGLTTIAVFSDADARSAHLDACDLAVRIGPAPARDSYLNIDALLAAAVRVGARAVHPGYGFLAESAAFARAAQQAGLTWVGPPPDAIALMGDKAQAKRLAQRSGVPTLPWIAGDPLAVVDVEAFAAEHGLPLVIKALAGGGGKGMRVVRAPAEIPAALEAARREGHAAFGDDRLLAERLLERPRHIEVQVLADAHGNCVHLGERECSLQRRQQKVIEEAPSVAVDERLRARVGAAAIALARACGYVGAGTVELLLAGDDAFFFLEMNTRLQVEHAVTELTYGIDLVELQLRIAGGEPIALDQHALAPCGHAIEVRVYAEDPRAGLMPSSGRLLDWRTPAGPGVRVDSGVRRGSVVTTDYEALLAKVVAYAGDRASAIARLDRALRDLVALGVITNVPLLRAALGDERVRAGALDTDLLERELQGLTPPPPDDLIAAAALAAWLADTEGLTVAPGPWRRRFAGHGEAIVDGGVLRLGERTWSAHAWRCDGAGCDGADLRVELDGLSRRYAVAVERAGIWVGRDGDVLHAEGERRQGALLDDATNALSAPLPGKVLIVNVSSGDRVQAGDALVVLESMKMELTISAPHDGVVERLGLRPGDRVERGQELVSLAPAREPSA